METRRSFRTAVWSISSASGPGSHPSNAKAIALSAATAAPDVGPGERPQARVVRRDAGLRRGDGIELPAEVEERPDEFAMVGRRHAQSLSPAGRTVKRLPRARRRR